MPLGPLGQRGVLRLSRPTATTLPAPAFATTPCPTEGCSSCSEQSSFESRPLVSAPLFPGERRGCLTAMEGQLLSTSKRAQRTKQPQALAPPRPWFGRIAASVSACLGRNPSSSAHRRTPGLFCAALGRARHCWTLNTTIDTSFSGGEDVAREQSWKQLYHLGTPLSVSP